MSVAHPSGNCTLWFYKGSSLAAGGSWFPVGEGGCHGMRTVDPDTNIQSQIMRYVERTLPRKKVVHRIILDISTRFGLREEFEI